MATVPMGQREVDDAKAVKQVKLSALTTVWDEFDLEKEDFSTDKGKLFYERMKIAKADVLAACRALAVEEEKLKRETP